MACWAVMKGNDSREQIATMPSNPLDNKQFYYTLKLLNDGDDDRTNCVVAEK
jgi:hypothetical protein